MVNKGDPDKWHLIFDYIYRLYVSLRRIIIISIYYYVVLREIYSVE